MSNSSVQGLNDRVHKAILQQLINKEKSSYTSSSLTLRVQVVNVRSVVRIYCSVSLPTANRFYVHRLLSLAFLMLKRILFNQATNVFGCSSFDETAI